MPARARSCIPAADGAPAAPSARRRVALRGLLLGGAWASTGLVRGQTPDEDEPNPPVPGEPAPGVFVDVPIWEGMVSFYGRGFAGRRTASGERFDPAARTMAHRFLPFGSWVKVTVLPAGPSVVVRVNDRGPAIASRIGDLSHAAAKSLGMISAGVVRARLELLKSGPAEADAPEPRAQARPRRPRA